MIVKDWSDTSLTIANDRRNVGAERAAAAAARGHRPRHSIGGVSSVVHASQLMTS
jgi:hypothetical protein